MTMEQWFMDDEFSTPLPESLSEECARVYGRGDVGVSFAQGLAAFLAIEEARAVMVEALTPEQQASDDITDEELARMERRLATHSAGWSVYQDMPRLIATLRTERAENERLRRITDAWGALEFSSRWAGPARTPKAERL